MLQLQSRGICNNEMCVCVCAHRGVTVKRRSIICDRELLRYVTFSLIGAVRGQNGHKAKSQIACPGFSAVDKRSVSLALELRSTGTLFDPGIERMRPQVGALSLCLLAIVRR